jgi:hypothetical protein
MIFLRKISHIAYHIAVIIMSAGIALSLPYTVKFLAQNFLVYWAHIENEKIFLVSIEIGVAIMLILFFTYLGRSWRNRRLSAMANLAGLLFVDHNKNPIVRRRIHRLKEKQGFARDIMIIGSTGSGTFVNPEGDLHQVLQNFRRAKIMLLDPTSEGAWGRAKSLRRPDITPESFKQQIVKSIAFLKGLRAVQRNIRLKLYQDMPLFKIAIFGDYISIRHYHSGLSIQDMPEYVLKHNREPGGFYSPFYQYFHLRWNEPEVPEYDLNTDELIYRDKAGNEERREKFNLLT